MSESTSTPRQDDEGTFVGGSFGAEDEAQEGAERLFAAGPGPEAEAEDVGPAEDVEGTGDTGGTDDVEGTGDAVPPGERNEPV